MYSGVICVNDVGGEDGVIIRIWVVESMVDREIDGGKRLVNCV